MLKAEDCGMDTTIDETGHEYGRWRVLSPAVRPNDSKSEGAWWLCECQCSLKTRKAIRGGTLRNGLTKSCGCLRIEKAKLPRKADAPFCAVLGKIRQSATKRELAFDLSLDQIKSLVVSECEYCGAKPSNTDKRLQRYYKFAYNGIDRVDNTLGYVTGNVVPCCRICNTAKMRQSREQFLGWVERVHHRALERMGRSWQT